MLFDIVLRIAAAVAAVMTVAHGSHAVAFCFANPAPGTPCARQMVRATSELRLAYVGFLVATVTALVLALFLAGVEDEYAAIRAATTFVGLALYTATGVLLTFVSPMTVRRQANWRLWWLRPVPVILFGVVCLWVQYGLVRYG